MCARIDGALVGWVNVAWDGAVHPFVLDTVVDVDYRRSGIGAQLVAVATEHARNAGCEWLHVDFDDHLTDFYLRSCGFTATPAAVIDLTSSLNCGRDRESLSDPLFMVCGSGEGVPLIQGDVGIFRSLG